MCARNLQLRCCHKACWRRDAPRENALESEDSHASTTALSAVSSTFECSYISWSETLKWVLRRPGGGGAGMMPPCLRRMPSDVALISEGVNPCAPRATAAATSESSIGIRRVSTSHGTVELGWGGSSCGEEVPVAVDVATEMAA